MMENNTELLKAISSKLSLLVMLQLDSKAAELNKSELVGKLVGFGLANDEIARILGTTKGTVEVLKSRNKEGKK